MNFTTLMLLADGVDKSGKYLAYYYLCGILILACMLLSLIASASVKRKFSKYSSVPNARRITGAEVAERLLRANGITSVTVNAVSGTLTDHYDPKGKTVRLSSSVYSSSSVASVAVAAHEIGHVVQDKKGYAPYRIRKTLVPIANFGSRIAIPLVLVGVLIDFFLAKSSLGFYLAILGVAFYGASTLFELATLPVELDASRRAKEMLVSQGILSENEKGGASKVLRAAAFTYVASLATSVVYFLRFLFWVLSIVGDGKRKK